MCQLQIVYVYHRLMGVTPVPTVPPNPGYNTLLHVCNVYVSGMHGAGLTHAMFLRSTSALIELFPSYWSAGEHFAAIATWRKLVYLRWVNNDLTAERPDGRTTVVPPSVVTALVRNAVRRLCPSSSLAADNGGEAAVPAAAAAARPRTSVPTR